MSKIESDVRNPQDAYWIFEDEISRGMNRLKGQIFNLVEASVSDKSQQEAIKGLIKGFANNSFHMICENMRSIATDWKILGEGQGVQNYPHID